MSSSLPYHEPRITTLLIQGSFILALNAVNHVLDSVIYCGLVGQILTGIAWGTPGGKLLPVEVEQVIVQLGYLGLILLVFEGGLSTSFRQLKANLLLSILVAITGIAIPIALSFILIPLVSATAIQSFAAGAALCSTSLGTTFALLSASGLATTRLGVVLSSAAMMDDVVGLIMVQVISNLGAGDIDAVAVVRPIGVSLAFAIVLPVACRFVVLPATKFLAAVRDRNAGGFAERLLRMKETALVLHTAILVGMVAGCTYAGTSSLLGAYMAGAMISWWDDEAPHPRKQHIQPPVASKSVSDDTSQTNEQPHAASGVLDSDETVTTTPDDSPSDNTASSLEIPPTPSNPGSTIFETYYHPPLQRILKPFFFASVGFSIPITKLFTPSVLWRGIVYSILMIIGKLVCGAWLLRVPLRKPLAKLQRLARIVRGYFGSKTKTTNKSKSQSAETSKNKSRKNPLSVYPSLMLGFAMVARGEIGFLISSLAESYGVFSVSDDRRNEEPSEIFLITTWAITICTVVGPVVMGYFVRRVRALERNAAKGRGAKEGDSGVLGVWGVQ